jgi:putative ABC transport system ATP-binding protein
MPDNDLANVRNKEIGFVFQQFNLLPRLTAAENVALPLVCRHFQKTPHGNSDGGIGESKPHRSCHHKPNELSGGQCQRVAIARALYEQSLYYSCGRTDR